MNMEIMILGNTENIAQCRYATLFYWIYTTATIQIAPKYHLATCQIQKNMATIRMATFCYLNHTMEFIATNQSISTVFWFDKQVSVSIRLQFLQDGTDMEGFGVIIGLALNLCWKSLNFNVGTEKGNMTNAQKGRLSGHKT